jgi:hypothetical protein
MVWVLVHHSHDSDFIFTVLGTVARGQASGTGGAGKLIVSRDREENWQELPIKLPADRVFWAAAD